MKFILLVLCLASVKAPAQQFADFIEPAGYSKVLEAAGDLDKDGIDDRVLVYNTNKKDGDHGLFRVMYICKIVKGSLKLWTKNTTVLRSSADCGFCVDSGINLSVKIKNNTLIIDQTFNHNTRHYSAHKNIFRYQNGDWFLIGSTFRDYDTCDFDFKYDINFSAKEISIAETYGDCDEEKKVPADRFYHFKYPFDGLPKMQGFRPGQMEIRRPGSKKYFYY